MVVSVAVVGVTAGVTVGVIVSALVLDQATGILCPHPIQHPPTVGVTAGVTVSALVQVVLGILCHISLSW